MFVKAVRSSWLWNNLCNLSCSHLLLCSPKQSVTNKPLLKKNKKLFFVLIWVSSSTAEICSQLVNWWRSISPYCNVSTHICVLCRPSQSSCCPAAPAPPRWCPAETCKLPPYAKVNWPLIHLKKCRWMQTCSTTNLQENVCLKKKSAKTRHRKTLSQKKKNKLVTKNKDAVGFSQ